MGDLEYIWGWSKNPKEEPSFLSWDDIYIYYNPATKRYYYQIDTGIYQYGGQSSAWNEYARLSEINEAFRNFVTEKGFSIGAGICYEDLQQDGAESLGALYDKFYATFLGYKKYYKL